MPKRAARGFLPGLFVMLALWPAASAAGPEAAARAAGAPPPVTDPVCVTWDKGCVVQRYSPRQGQWQTWAGPRSVLPLAVTPAVGPHAAAALDPMRGCRGWLFDLNAEKWTAIPRSPIPPPRSIIGVDTAAFVGDRLVVWGRIDPRDDAPQGAVLDTKTMTWKPMAKAPVAPRYRCVTAVVGSRLLVWGGYGPLGPGHIGPLNDGAVYDVEKDAWDKMPDPPVPGHRYGCSAAAWNGRMVIVGGRGPRGQGVIRTGMIFDPDGRTWEKMNDLPEGLGVQAACAVAGDRLFVWSGAAGAGRGENAEGAAYDFATGKWEMLPPAPIPPRKLSFARADATGLTVWGGWLSGGDPATFLTDGATYDLKQKRWQAIPRMPNDVPYEMHPGW